jgi:hypothetical protein
MTDMISRAYYPRPASSWTLLLLALYLSCISRHADGRNSQGSDKMRDEFDGRLWDANHDRFSADLDTLFKKIGETFARLHRIQWSAPWRNDALPAARRTGQA